MMMGMVDSRSKVYQKSREISDENHNELIKEIEKEIQKLGGDPGLFDVQKILEPLLAAIKDRNFDFSLENKKSRRSREDYDSDDEDSNEDNDEDYSRKDFIPAEILNEERDLEEGSRLLAEQEAKDRAKRLEEALREAEEKSEAKVLLLCYLDITSFDISTFLSFPLPFSLFLSLSLSLSLFLSLSLSLTL